MRFKAARCAPLIKNPTASKSKIQNNFHAKPPAFPTLINERCAAVLTEAHHPTSLTEEQHDESHRRRGTKTQRGTKAGEI
jgi:hypothetical protein